MKECVKHHHAILNVCLAMENFFNPYCLIKSLQITFQLCFLLFISVNVRHSERQKQLFMNIYILLSSCNRVQLSLFQQSTTSILRNINLIQYVSLTSMELLIFTYFGEVLRIQSLRIGESLMRSSWVERSVAMKKDALIILQNASRPVTLTSGKFYPMDIQRFKSVRAPQNYCISFSILLRPFRLLLQHSLFSPFCKTCKLKAIFKFAPLELNSHLKDKGKIIKTLLNLDIPGFHLLQIIRNQM